MTSPLATAAEQALADKPAGLPCPCLAVDTLASLPWARRIQAYADFDNAILHWNLARLERRNGGWQWRLDIRRARRFWGHYRAAVRAAQSTRIAA